MHQIVDEYDGKVAWVYRHYPIKELHSRAPKEAEASECISELGGNTKFWEYIDKIFAITEAKNNLDPAMLTTIASQIGIDTEAFNSCLQSGRYADQIVKDVEAAVKAGARGTPYSIIIKGNEQVPINGAEPIEEVRAMIDSVLK